jgi:hypothetical protein
LKKQCNHLFPGRGSDRVSLARLFKAGTISASIRESRQRRLILQIDANRRCRD